MLAALPQDILDKEATVTEDYKKNFVYLFKKFYPSLVTRVHTSS